MAAGEQDRRTGGQRLLGQPNRQDRSGGVGEVALTKAKLAAYGSGGLNLVRRRLGTVTAAAPLLRRIGIDGRMSLITTDTTLDGGRSKDGAGC